MGRPAEIVQVFLAASGPCPAPSVTYIYYSNIGSWFKPVRGVDGKLTVFVIGILDIYLIILLNYED